MKQRQITVLSDVVLITCIIQRGRAEQVINAAINSGAQGVTVHYGQGMGVRERLGVLGVAVEAEKEIINIVVSTEQVEKIFEEMFIAGQLDTPGMGMMYTTPLDKAATHIPQEILEQLGQE